MEIFKLLGTIAINNSEANRSIDETGSKATGLASNMQHAFERIGNLAAACGKAIIGGLAIGATAMGGLMKSSIGEYAEYEQLAGGVEKLFKDSADTVKGYADEAYKTAGLSANEYLETVTSFAATLIAGLNGDTAAAAKVADIAIQDMADNANTFGTNIKDIQNAYQGFAKDNYSMLDNLKLGYGGTAEEMARLVNDSGVLGEAVTVTADTINDVSFDQIIAAIHVMQDRMGIAGATAQEAATTISGSFDSFKASWNNLLVGFADGEKEIQPLLDAFLETGKTWLSNIGEVLPEIKSKFVEAFAYIGEQIKTFWENDVWPTIQQYAKAELGIDLPEWSEIYVDVKTWWNTLKTKIEALGDFLLSLRISKLDEDKDGTITSEEIIKWWSNVRAKMAETIKIVFGLGAVDEDPDGTTTAQKIQKWWSKVVDKLSLQLVFKVIGTGITVELANQLGVDVDEEDLAKGMDTREGIYQQYVDSLDGVDAVTAPTPTYGDLLNYTSNGGGSSTFTDSNGIIRGGGDEGRSFGSGSGGAPDDWVMLNEEFKNTVQEWSSTFNVDEIKTAVAQGIAEGLAGVTITTGNVTLNDGALVGRILPRINLGLGQLAARGMRGVM